MVGDHSPSPEAPLRSKVKQVRKEQKDIRRGANARRVMERSRGLGVIEKKGIKGDDSIECFLLTRVRSTF